MGLRLSRSKRRVVVVEVVRGAVVRGGRGRRSIAKFLLAPFAALQRAAAEGAPLVVHAGFAVGCVVLQQVMARHAPGGILSTRVVRTLPLVLERSLLS